MSQPEPQTEVNGIKSLRLSDLMTHPCSIEELHAGRAESGAHVTSLKASRRVI